MKKRTLRQESDVSNVRYKITCIVLVICLTKAASATEILIGDDKSRPESLTIAPGGALIIGSLTLPGYKKNSALCRPTTYIEREP